MSFHKYLKKRAPEGTSPSDLAGLHGTNAYGEYISEGSDNDLDGKEETIYGDPDDAEGVGLSVGDYVKIDPEMYHLEPDGVCGLTPGEVYIVRDISSDGRILLQNDDYEQGEDWFDSFRFRYTDID